MTKSKPVAPQWAGRVEKWKIVRIYEDDAGGIHDEELLNDVAYRLYARCKSMIVVEEARHGRAACPVCESIIKHTAQKGSQLACNNCNWMGSWDDYRRSLDGHHLIAPGLQPFCQEYVQKLPQAKFPKEQMYWIDWLIHRSHWEGTALPGQSGAASLIQGRAQDVNAFLAALSAGTHRQQRLDLEQLWSEEQKEQIKGWRKAADRRKHK